MRTARPTRPAVLLLAASLVAVAATAPSASAADRSTQSPKAILAELTRDLPKVQSYRFSGTVTDEDGKARLSGAADRAGKAKLSLSQGGSSLRIVLLPDIAYWKANASFWKDAAGKDAATKNGAAAVKLLADRWVKTSSSDTQELTSIFRDLAPKQLATCTTNNLGTLTNGGTVTVGGTKAVVIIDKGDKPGTTPGKLYVAASGPALPLREVQTGKRRPGGKLNTRCEDKDDTSTAGDVRFSGFDKPLEITAPKKAIELPSDDGPTTAA